MADLFVQIKEEEQEKSSVAFGGIAFGSSEQVKGKKPVSTDLAYIQKQEGFGLVDGFLDEKAKAKELLPQINWIVTHRKVEYVKPLLSLKVHSSVQVRRKVAEGLGHLGTKEIVLDLRAWQEIESDRDTVLLLETVIDKLERGISGQNLQKDVRILTVSEALSVVKKLIGEGVYIIEGEITESRPFYQMHYFSLKDNEDSKLECASFVGLLSRAGFPLNEGLTVRLTGKFKLSAKSKIYFEPSKIELTGEGELARNLKFLEQKLFKEGLFDEKRKRLIPKIPQNILLLASTQSAAIDDFVKVLGQRRSGITIYHLPIKTQGVGAEFEILERLQEVNELTVGYGIDTVVLTRGGGSSDDLIVFNSEKVVRALYAVNRPTIVAIGHERDTTLAELAADLRASTPSNAAELASLSNNEIVQQITSAQNFLQKYFQDKKQRYLAPNSQLYLAIAKIFKENLHETKLLCKQTDNLVLKLTTEVLNQTNLLWQQILLAFKMQIQAVQPVVDKAEVLDSIIAAQLNAQKTLTNHVMQTIVAQYQAQFQSARSQLDLCFSHIEAHDPKLILSKGYALVRQGQKVVEKVADFDQTQDLQIQLQDGEFTLKKYV